MQTVRAIIENVSRVITDVTYIRLFVFSKLFLSHGNITDRQRSKYWMSLGDVSVCLNLHIANETFGQRTLLSRVFET